jgi:hypothetical protein
MKSLIKRILIEETKERNYDNIVKLATNYIKNVGINGLCNVKLVKSDVDIIGVIFTQGHIGDTKLHNLEGLLKKIFHISFILVEYWKSSCSEFNLLNLDESQLNEATTLVPKLLKMINNGGFLTAIRSVGGYGNLRKIMKGTDYLSKDVMVSTIKEVLEGKGTLGLYELGITPITIRTIGNEEHHIEAISDDYLIIDVYVDYDLGDGDQSIDSYSLSYEDIKRNDLFELFDAIIEYYEDYSDDENDYM